MPGRYRVVADPGFERETRRLRARQPRLYDALLRGIELLEADPFNLVRRGNICKLVNVAPGNGQFRLRIGTYRLRYDIVGDQVILHSMRPRSRSYR